MNRITVINKKLKTKKTVNVPSYEFDVSSAGFLGINPIFYNVDSSNFYTLSVLGELEAEYIQINLNTTQFIFPSFTCLYNPMTNLYYSITVSGTLGSEVLNIISSSSNQITPIAIYNPMTNLYYSITVSGTLGSEVLNINVII